MIIISFLAVYSCLNPFGVLFGVLSFLLAGAYYVILEGWGGFTLGKLLGKIRVVDNDFNRPGLVKALIRTAFRLIEINPLFMGGIPAGIIAAVSKQKQRLGDIVANTFVLKRNDIPEEYRKPRLTTFKKTVISLVIAMIFVSMIGEIAFTVVNFNRSAAFYQAQSKEVIISKDAKYQLALLDGWSENKALLGRNKDFNMCGSTLLQDRIVGVITEPKSDLAGVDLKTYADTVKYVLKSSTIF